MIKSVTGTVTDTPGVRANVVDWTNTNDKNAFFYSWY